MNVHISYRLHKTPAVEKDIQHQVEKLRRRLQVFRPELIHLKGMVEEISAREGTSVSLRELTRAFTHVSQEFGKISVDVLTTEHRKIWASSDEEPRRRRYAYNGYK